MNKCQKVKDYYNKGFWTAEQVKNAVLHDWITEAECEEILAE